MLNLIEQQRYQRQIALDQVTEQGQIQLKQARVLVVGAGGLASSLLLNLVGSGVGFIRLYDADVVDLSNLHRQHLYRMSDLQQPKVKAAQQHLSALNPEVEIEAHISHVHSANIVEACTDIDLVVDAADRFATTYLLSDYCFEKKIPLISASVLNEQGYVGGFCGANAPSYRAVFPKLPKTAMSCATTGVLPSTVSVIASLQAHMVLNVLLKLPESALGQLISLNLATWHIQSLAFHQAPEPAQTMQWLDQYQIQTNDIVLDLREVHEVKADLCPQVMYVSMSQLESLNIQAIGHRRIICACKSGIRAAKASEILRKRGFQDIYLMAVFEE